jgi:hypothetical protein
MTFPADLRPDELREQTGIPIAESEDYDTAAGFVLRELGRIPEPGDEVTLNDGAVLRVERMDGRRIARLRYFEPPVTDDTGEVPLIAQTDEHPTRTVQPGDSQGTSVRRGDRA